MKVRSLSLNKWLGAGVAVFIAAILATACTVSASADLNFYVDETRDEYAEDSAELNKQIMEEGMVLLSNKNNALPLEEGSKVTVLGTGSFNTYWGESSANAEGKYCYVSDSLADAGFEVNPDTASVYSDPEKATIGGATVYLDPDISALDGVVSTFASYGDAAIITLSRTCRESSDLVTDEEGMEAVGISAAHQLALYPNEKDLIKLAKNNFDKVIVLLNSSTVMQIPELAEENGEYEVDAVMYIGLPGQYGLRALGEVLNGEVSPSGKTVDTWYSDFTMDPTYQNACSNIGVIDAEDNSTYSIEYEEGIYLGYKYYETAYEEIAAGNYEPAGYELSGSTDEEKADDWYSQAVTFPFGYGLSYTTFEQEFVTEQIDITGLSFDDYIDIEVKVTNTGNIYSGKDVVEIYNCAPYTQNEIEKSSVVLVGFAKTDTLAPGESQTVTVSVRVGDLASYDYNDANNDYWYGYEIEAGSYSLSLRSDAHTEIASLAFEIIDSVKFENDGSLADSDAKNTMDSTVFSTGDDFDTLKLVSAENGGDFRIMSRSDFAGTFPTAPSGNNTYKENVPTLYSSVFTPDMDDDSYPWYVSEDEIPDDWTQDSGTSYTLYQISGIDYTSNEIISGGVFDGMTGAEAWTAFMNQLTWTEIVNIVGSGSQCTVSVASINKPVQSDVNGPEQLGDNGTSWACANIMASTYNTELMVERGLAMAHEGLYDGVTGWYGPTANLNRTPFGGRNNIYYSEDSLVTGKIAAALVRGAQSGGLIAYIKHFALNEQETQRHGLGTYLTEQALRETYLKAFEYVIKEGEALGVMQSLNRVGAVNGFGNYALDVVVLREEWGFKGAVVTDAYNASLVHGSMAQRCGSDFPLGAWRSEIYGDWDASLNMVTYNGVASPTQWYVIRNSAMHVLYMAANSNQVTNGYNISAFTLQNVYANSESSSKILLTVGETMTLNVGVSAEVLGTDQAVYTATGLPSGLAIDQTTGVISGTPTETGDARATVRLSITADGETWISRTLTISFSVSEADAGASSGGGLTAGAIAGICVGAVVVVAAAAAVSVFFIRKKSDKNK